MRVHVLLIISVYFRVCLLFLGVRVDLVGCCVFVVTWLFEYI